MKADKIYLVGFMAAGKSTVAQELGRRLDWRVEDIDLRIEARERRSVADIFALNGEAHFRAIERAVVLDLIPMRHAVVATGGGTFFDADSRALMKSDGAVFWLDVPLIELVDRIPSDGSRPLAASVAQLEHLYLLRRAAYEEAHVRLDASRQAPGAIVDAIVEWLEA
jgi:shikimate kinase